MLRYGLLLWLGIEAGTQLKLVLSGFEGLLLLSCGLFLGFGGRAKGAAVVGSGLLLALIAGSPSPGKPAEALAVAPAQLQVGLPVAAVISDCAAWRDREFSRTARCQLNAVRIRTRVVAMSGAIHVSTPLGSVQALRCGRLRGTLRLPVGPKNPPVEEVGRHPVFLLTVKSERLIEAFDCQSTVPHVARNGSQLRSWIEQRLLGSNQAPKTFSQRLSAAMWLGQRDQLERREQAGLRNWGLTHLLSVSGLHVGVLLGLGLLFIQSWPGSRFIRRPLLALVWVALAGVWIVIAVGPRVSVMRALVMAAIVVVAQLVRRPSGALAGVGLALALLAATSPESVIGTSFRLSFAATLGIVGGAPLLVAAWAGLPRWIAMPLAVSVAAQLATLPWTLAIHPIVPLAGPFANLVAVPAAGLTLIEAPLWMLLGTTGVPAAFTTGWVGALVTDALALPGRAIEWFALLDPVPWLQPTWAWHPYWSALWAVGAFVFALAPRRRWPVLVLLLAALWWPAGGATKISFLDVGQGDATLVRSGKRAMLIDGGGWRGGEVGARVLVPVVARERLRRIDVAILTHADFDHCAGLLELSWVIEIGELWVGPGEHDGACGRELLDRFSDRTVIVSELEVRRLGRWSLTVASDGADASSANGRSLVLRIESNGWSVLLTGDVDAKAEALVLGKHAGPAGQALMDVDWLKVAHHGSKTSTTQALLDRASPSVAVISAGRRNPYGHPSRVVVQRLTRFGSRIVRTDLDGRIDYCPSNDC